MASNNRFREKAKIIFIDDDQNILDGIKRSLHNNREQWEISYMSDVNAACQSILHSDFDIVVSDIKMPAMTGLELLEKIKSELKEKRPEFIIITGIEDKELKRAALNLDATDLLNKPIQKEDLLARLNNAIRLKSFKDKICAQNELLEQQLIQSQKMEVVGLMTSGIAHDFNNILSVISNYSQLLKMLAKDNPNIEKRTEKIQEASGHGQKIIQQLLNFVKKKNTVFEKINLNTIINDSIELLKTTLSKKVSIQFYQPQNNHEIMADQTQIFQVIMNLCLNAAKAMDHEGNISIRLNKENSDLKETIVLEIADNGPGIDTSIIKSLSSIKTSEGGTGLGLTIVQRIIKNHSGKLNIKSEPGIGTTFTIIFPEPADQSQEGTL
jgi:signal transduction histidine kinase